MAIGFNRVSADARVPFAYVEFEQSGAVEDAGVQAYRSLLVGTKRTEGATLGTASTEDPRRLASADDAAREFGVGSVLHQMALAWFAINQSSELYGIALDLPAGAGEQGTTLTFTGNATAAGTVALYIGDTRIAVPVASGSTPAQTAALVKAAIDNYPNTGFTAAAAAGVVTITAVGDGAWAGLTDQGIPVQHSIAADESLPGGVALAIASSAAGAGEPDLDDLWTAIGDVQYHVIVTPYQSAAALTSIETELASRWGPVRPIDGMAFAAARGTTGTVTAVANNRNSPHVCVMDAATSPAPQFKWAAQVGATVALHGPIDPARPFQTLPLTVPPPPIESRRSYTQRNNLLRAGIAAHTVDAGGTVRIDRLITEYRKSPAGVDDESYLDVNTPLTLSFIRWDWRSYMARKYPRHKLGDDGRRYRRGQPVMTPSLGRAEALAKFREWEELALVEAPAQFKRDLIVERNPRDRNRLDWRIRPDLINQLRILGTQIAFLL